MIVCVHGIWNLFISVDIKTEDKPETRIFSDIPSGLSTVFYGSGWIAPTTLHTTATKKHHVSLTFASTWEWGLERREKEEFNAIITVMPSLYDL